MVTYQFQLINLHNGNSDVFQQLESNRSPLGQPCCVFVPTFLNKATSPINIHTHTHACAYIYICLHTHTCAHTQTGQLQLRPAGMAKVRVSCLWFFFVIQVWLLQVWLFELCEIKQKERNLHWMTILSGSGLPCEWYCADHSNGFEKG